MTNRPTAAFDFKADEFPITIELYNVANDEVVKTIVVDEPGAVEIPGIGPALGITVGARVTLATGETLTK